MKFRFILSTLVLLVGQLSMAQPIFSNPITGSNPSFTNPYTAGQFVAANVTASGIARGSGVVANIGSDRFNLNSWNTATLDPTAYFTFTITPSGGTDINFDNFVYTGQASGSGPTNFAFRSSVDGYTADIGTPNAGGTTIDLSGAAYQNVSNAITFRLYAWGASASSGTYSINEFEFNGTVTNCPAITITPVSGPVGTEVTITAPASNNLTGATVTIGGVSASVTQVSATQVKAIVPAGATTGTLVVNPPLGCTASIPFTVITSAISGCEGSGSSRPNLFISEVTDHGSGSHSYVEIFNATGAAVNLLNYSIRIHNNGSATPTAGSTITLPSFNLANNASYVIAFGGGDASTTYGGISADYISTAGGINDDDNIRLHNSTGIWIDLWGLTTGATFTVSGSNYYYRRKLTGITAPSTTWNVNDWTYGTPVDYTDIGSYSFSAGAPPSVTAHPSFSPSCNSTSITVAGTQGVAGGLLLAYQWYVAAPGATTWSLVSNSGLYSGATAATLYINNISTLDGYQYYAQVRENSATCYSASNATMIKVSSSVWNAGAWTPSAPTIVSGVTINGNYNTATHGSFDACSVTVSSGATLTIAADDYVLIQSNLTVNTGGSLTVSNDGSLVMINNNGVVTNNGSMNVVRTTTPYKKYDYTYWSSPVFTANIGTTFPGWRTDYSFTFNTANFADLTGVGGTGPADGFDDNDNAWTPAPSATTMVRAKGYAIMAPTTGTFPASSTVTFTGRVNNGIITLPMALSGNAANVNDDFNLIGNPYPSAVDGNLFINTNSNISGTLYFWTHTSAMSSSAPGPGAYNFITDDYAMYNLSGGTASVSGSTAPTGKIASGQGFFVEAVSAGNVTFNNAMRNKNHDNGDFFRANQGVRDRLWLNFENLNGLFSQQLIGYFDESTNDTDWGYDGIINPTQNAVSFYSLINDDTYRIQGRAPFTPTDMVPLGYKSVAGQFSISIGNIEGQLTNINTNVFLEDLWLDELHDLKQSPYTFSTEAGTFNDRFVLRYLSESLSTVDISPLTGLQTAVRNQKLFLRSSDMITEIILYDMTGRKIYEATPDATEFSTDVIAAKGVVIARIKLANGTTTDRKIIF